MMHTRRCEQIGRSASILAMALLTASTLLAGEVRVMRREHFQPASEPIPHLPLSDGPGIPCEGDAGISCSLEVSQGIWHRPRFWGLRKAERCSPDPFHPRGLGHLFARPSTPCRIDYAPARLRTLDTEYGPYYFRRADSPYCECCQKGGHCTHLCPLGDCR